MNKGPERRSVRSYVKRGKITPAQLRALEELLPTYAIELSSTESTDFSKLQSVTHSNRSHYLEIGFGNGSSLAYMASQYPDARFTGIEVHRSGVGRLLIELNKKEIGNVQIINHDAVEVLRDYKLPLKFDGIYLLFPDPWPKKRHHKRRIVTPEFALLIANVIKPDGYFYIATDYQHYADEIQLIMHECPQFNLVSNPQTLPNLIKRPETKYEKRGLRLEHKITDLIYQLA